MSKITVAVIAAGGKGTRLKEKTGGKIPKGLVHICGKPILSYQLEALSKAGIRDVHISFGNRKFVNLFKTYVKNNLVPEMNYEYSIHRYNALYTFKNVNLNFFLKDRPFIFSFDDLFYTESVIKRILDQYKEKKCSIILKSPIVECKTDIEFILQDNYIVSWKKTDFPTWTVGPILVLDEKANKIFFEEMKKQRPDKLMFLKTCITKKIKVYTLEQIEPLININRLRDFYRAEMEIRKLKS